MEGSWVKDNWDLKDGPGSFHPYRNKKALTEFEKAIEEHGVVEEWKYFMTLTVHDLENPTVVAKLMASGLFKFVGHVHWATFPTDILEYLSSKQFPGYNALVRIEPHHVRFLGTLFGTMAIQRGLWIGGELREKSLKVKGPQPAQGQARVLVLESHYDGLNAAVSKHKKEIEELQQRLAIAEQEREEERRKNIHSTIEIANRQRDLDELSKQFQRADEAAKHFSEECRQLRRQHAQQFEQQQNSRGRGRGKNGGRGRGGWHQNSNHSEGGWGGRGTGGSQGSWGGPGTSQGGSTYHQQQHQQQQQQGFEVGTGGNPHAVAAASAPGINSSSQSHPTRQLDGNPAAGVPPPAPPMQPHPDDQPHSNRSKHPRVGYPEGNSAKKPRGEQQQQGAGSDEDGDDDEDDEDNPGPEWTDNRGWVFP